MKDITGMAEIRKLFSDIEKIPDRALGKASRAGSNIALKDARKNSPKKTLKLARGIKLKKEKRKKGKHVYQIGFFGASGKGEEFVKVSKDGKRSFYPVSQEFGWIDEKGVKHEGKRFLRNAIDNNRDKIQKAITDVIGKELDKLR